MEQHDLNRMFDALAPTRSQEQEGLHRLLRTERKGRPMTKLKKLTVIGIAAALMVISCAAAVVTGIDKRLMKRFGAQLGQEEWLAAVVAANGSVTHSYPSGWTVQIGQVLADRYMVTAVMDFTAPPDVDLQALVEREGEFDLVIEYSVDDKDGVVLQNDIYYPNTNPVAIEARDRQTLWPYQNGECYKAGTLGSNELEILENSNLERGHLSVLWTFYKSLNFTEAVGEDMLGARLRLSPKALRFAETKKLLYIRGSEETWTYEITLPEKDPGLVCPTKHPIQINSDELEIQTIYLSPLQLACDFYYPDESFCFPRNRDSVDYVLNLSDGEVLAMKPGLRCCATGVNGLDVRWELYHVSVQPERLIDPAQVQSVTLYGQTYELK
mgnify:CR=1 FL=1